MTSGRTTQPSIVLLDSNVIISAHELGIWEWLTQRYRILVPSVVVKTEVLFYATGRRERGRVPIHLSEQAEAGRIEELTATATELARVYAGFDPSFVGGLHAGEAEGLALFLAGRVGEAAFCSGDALAIQALAMLGFAQQGVSLEVLLGRKKHGGVLAPQFTNDFLCRNLSRGQENRITGMGLNTRLLD